MTEHPERSMTQLEEEGEIAADFIEELLDIADLDGDLDISVSNNRVYLSVDSANSEDLKPLSKPDTVAALQEITRIAVQNKTGAYSRLILDIDGSRNSREKELRALVEKAVERLNDGATEAALPPMSSYERKIVHDLVAEHGLISESSGEGRDRHTVVRR